MNKETVLITGASSGIGLALAREFASQGHPLVLTAPVAAELRDVAADVGRSYGVSVRTIAKDFETISASEEIFAELAADRVSIEILVNNAGFGQRGKFWETPLDRDIGMLRVNIEAVVRLTKLFLPGMVKRGHGRILNTASVAGFEPGPMLAVYHATKAFVLSFSEAIATELEDTAVTVTALCPGPVDTDFFPKADMIDTQVFQRGKVAAPAEVAKAAYQALMAGERVIVPGGVNKAMVFPRRFMTESAQAKMNEKMYEDADPAKRKRERGDIEAEQSKPKPH
ncbi:SDR family oxidoreductase [Opitutus sp. ER46]|uniref:SDR family NAD(P)-dependent oxidoreductase n=1 Tax=Opitutus sp. ER46 TaxID=2161864 RepID=UPI000D31298B|nr:SDR family oxidoreductase [Opitutus sp. ER46]PTX91772.1 short-chain dehydrogenase [Opitutus sp. ER46]